ncbi:MAG TPA: hypothetical protein VK121_04210 [Pseudogracilibacillus sp.]|nr:hypothetical protein [Pseudogracilibacillus sp.]
MSIETNRISNQIMILWIPLSALIASSVFLYTDRETFAIGLILLGLGLDGFMNLRLLGSNLPTDEFYLSVLEKGRDIGFRIVYSMIVILIIVHYAYQPLFTSFVLITLLYTAYAATTLSTMFFIIKNKYID